MRTRIAPPQKALRFLNVLIVVGLVLGAVAPVAGAAQDQALRGHATASATEGRARTAVVAEMNGRVQTESAGRTIAKPTSTALSRHIRCAQ